jgi:hypothetical protein
MHATPTLPVVLLELDDLPLEPEVVPEPVVPEPVLLEALLLEALLLPLLAELDAPLDEALEEEDEVDVLELADPPESEPEVTPAPPELLALGASSVETGAPMAS